MLLDTHTMIWWLLDDARLSSRVREIVEDPANLLLWSVVGSWELALKHSLGKLDLGRPIKALLADIVGGQGGELLGISHRHCVEMAGLPLYHRDPFDRMLVAQARVEGVPLLTRDAKLGAYDIETIW